MIQKRNNPPLPKPCESVPQEFGFPARPSTTSRTCVPESKAYDHDEACSRWPHKRKSRWESTKRVVVKVKTFLRHIVQRKRLVEFWYEQGALSRHTWNQILCRAHSHGNPNDLPFLPRSQIHRKRQASTNQSCVDVPLDQQSFCQQHLGS